MTFSRGQEARAQIRDQRLDWSLSPADRSEPAWDWNSTTALSSIYKLPCSAVLSYCCISQKYIYVLHLPTSPSSIYFDDNYSTHWHQLILHGVFPLLHFFIAESLMLMSTLHRPTPYNSCFSGSLLSPNFLDIFILSPNITLYWNRCVVIVNTDCFILLKWCFPPWLSSGLSVWPKVS